MIRVLLVDDHMPLRAGTRSLLHEAADIEIVAEAARGHEALELAEHLRPDVVLLDINLPDLNGVEVARTLSQDLPEVKVLVLTGYNYEQYVRTLFAIGVNGYLLKSDPALELIAAVREAARGGHALSAEIAVQLADRTSRSGIVATGTLSDRERDVLTLVGEGLCNKEIGRRLGIKASTVDTYLSNVMAKLEVHSRSEAFRVAVERGIIVLGDG